MPPRAQLTWKPQDPEHPGVATAGGECRQSHSQETAHNLIVFPNHLNMFAFCFIGV